MPQKISQKVIFSLLIKCSIIILVFAKRVAAYKLPKEEVSKLNKILTVIEIIVMGIAIVTFCKEVIDWYIDYRIEKKITDKKKERCHSSKDEQR